LGKIRRRAPRAPISSPRQNLRTTYLVRKKIRKKEGKKSHQPFRKSVVMRRSQGGNQRLGEVSLASGAGARRQPRSKCKRTRRRRKFRAARRKGGGRSQLSLTSRKRRRAQCLHRCTVRVRQRKSSGPLRAEMVVCFR